MSWFSKQLKRSTKILDPVGAQLRKSTGGSYGDPMNWYNSKPNTNQPWQPSPSRPLMAAPNGQQTLGTTDFAGNTGGRTYAPNPFQNPMPQNATPGLTAQPSAKNPMLPAGPVKAPGMGFGGPAAQPQMMQNTGMNQQQAMINALRGGVM